jgi:hypothetical protein
MSIHRFPRVPAAGALALVATGLLTAQDYESIINQGRTLSAASARQLETSLIANPRNLETRAQLVGYYAAKGTDPAGRLGRFRQIEWLIHHEPESLLLNAQVASFRPSDFGPPDGAYLQTLQADWQEQVNSHPNDAIVLENAVNSLLGAEFYIRGNGLAKSTDFVSGRTTVQYLKRLRELDPGNPEWAFSLAAVYAMAVTQGSELSASADTKRLAAAVLSEIEKSHDPAVLGLTGAALRLGAPASRTPIQTATPPTRLDERLLRQASALNPKNPAWLTAPTLTVVQETDLWPGGVVRAMAVPPGAIRIPPEKEAAVRPTLRMEPVPNTDGSRCSAGFEALVGRDGKIKTLQVIAFEHLNYAFISRARYALRMAQYPPALSGGRPVEFVTRINMTCYDLHRFER